MKTLLITLMLLCGLAHARLGETLEQCKARYGEPTSKDAATAVVYFEKSGVIIAAHFVAGKVDCVRMARVDGEAWSADQVKALADANMGEGWRELAEQPGFLYPRHVNGKHGLISEDYRSVRFFTREYWEALLAAGGSIQSDAGQDGAPRIDLKGF
ncbi:MAG: hypothetical protein HS117_19390 [Verrucomicrobiaceae bacterium]|nr:hypothetical protein [Verrucomicrobiaceae bacterium]